MQEQKQKIKGFHCKNKSQNITPKDIPSWQLLEFENEDAEYLGARQYFLAQNTQVKENPATKTKQEFDDLIKEWTSAIKYKSLESQQINHSAFLRIIAIGNKILPSIFEEFSKRPFIAWLKALSAIVGKDVASEAKSFPEAVKLWMDWAKENDYLSK